MDTLSPESTPPSNKTASAFAQLMQGISPQVDVGAGGDANLSAPELAKLTQLYESGAAIKQLKDFARWSSSKAQINAHLNQTSFASVLMRLFIDGSSGVLSATHATGESKTIAIVHGLPIAIASSVENEWLGSYLVRSGVLSRNQALHAKEIMKQHGRPVGWALLHMGAVTVDGLWAAQKAAAEEGLLHLLSWSDGEAAFYVDNRVAGLAASMVWSPARLLAQGFAYAQELPLATLRDLTAPLFAAAAPLRFVEVPPELDDLVAAMNPTMMQALQRGVAAADLAKTLEGRNDNQLRQDLANLYMLVNAGLVRLENGNTVQLPALPSRDPVGADRHDAPLDPLAEYQLQKDLLSQGRKLLSAGNAIEGINKLTQLAQRQKEPTAETFAYLAVGFALHGDAPRATDYANRALKINPQDALAHAGMSRAVLASGNRSSAAQHRRTALSLAQNDKAWYAEVAAALALGEGPASQPPAEGTALIGWIMVALTAMVLFVSATVLKLGSDEYFYQPDDGFFYFRRLLLLAVGIAGVSFIHRTKPQVLLRQLRWSVSPKIAGLALGWGAIIGFLSPVQRITGSTYIVLVLTIIHVFSEEIFFRAFITRLTSITLESSPRLAICLSGMIFGLYHATYYSFWFETGFLTRLQMMGLIAVFAGTPYAWLWSRRRNVLPALLCHGMCNVLMMLHSIYVRGGF